MRKFFDSGFVSSSNVFVNESLNICLGGSVMNLDHHRLLDFAKDHQANVFEATERERINEVKEYSLKRRVLVVLMSTGIYFSYILFQFLNL